MDDGGAREEGCDDDHGRPSEGRSSRRRPAATEPLTTVHLRDRRLVEDEFTMKKSPGDELTMWVWWLGLRHLKR